MNRIILTCGTISGAAIALLTFGSMALNEGDGHTTEFEWLGYAIMIVALSVIFFAVKSYRDDRLGGTIRFRTAFKLGLGISIVAGVVYALGWEIYYQTLGGEFIEGYSASYLDRMRADGASAAEVAAARQRMEEFNALYEFMPARLGITLLEIIPVGIVISLLSAALLRNSEILPAGAR